VRCIDGRVFGLNAEDGRRLWIHDRSVPLLTLRGTSDPLVRAGQVFIGYDDGMVSGLRVADGSVLWEQRVSEPEGRTELERMADIDGPMAIVGTELYVVTYRGRMAGMALESGRLLWVKDLSSHSGLSLRRTQLAASDREDAVWLVDRRNGATLWRDEQLKRRQLTRPVFYGNQLVVVDQEGYMHFYDVDSGEFSARTRASRNPPSDAPLVVGNTMYLLDSDGTLTAWRARPTRQTAGVTYDASLPVVAIVGRPNVGKSTLFNALTRTRDALVADTPGVTRDRIYGRAIIDGQPVILIDTGGLDEAAGEVESGAQVQTRQAMKEADFLVLITDGRAGILPVEHQIASELRALDKPVMHVVNKTDGIDQDMAIAEAAELGYR
jgi:small GTP-binding protein